MTSKTKKVDTKTTDKEVEQLLNLASVHPDYPDKKDSFLLMKEYDRKCRMVFLYVTDNYTTEQVSFLQEYLREHLHPRTVVSIIKSQKRFD